MTHNDWFHSQKYKIGDMTLSEFYDLSAKAWNAAHIEGQKAMRERAAHHVESFVGWASDHNLEATGDSIRAMPIEGE